MRHHDLERRIPVWTLPVFLLNLISSLAASSGAIAATQTWTNAGGDRRWENPANWSGGTVPGPGDDVVIPATSIGSPLLVDEEEKCIRSLRMESRAEGSSGFQIRGDGGCLSVTIKASENVTIGRGCFVFGGDGSTDTRYHPDGGEVTIRAGGDITNRGEIGGGYGASIPARPSMSGGPTAGAGGDVTLTAVGDIDNSGGVVRSGAGGSIVSGDPGEVGRGGDSGSITVTSGGNTTSGRMETGSPGSGVGPDQDDRHGADGETDVTSLGPITILPLDSVSGGDVMLRAAQGEIFLSGRTEPGVFAARSAYLDAGAGQINLLANPPGTPVVVAGATVCLAGPILIEPFLPLEPVTQPPFESSESCALRCAAAVRWREDFESPVPLEHPWSGWIGGITFDAALGASIAQTGFRSAAVDGSTRAIHPLCFERIRSATWSFSASQYVPSEFADSGASGAASTLRLLDTYVAGGARHDAVEISTYAASESIQIAGGGSPSIVIPYESDRWVKIAVVIDLDEDWTRVYYDDALVSEYPWTGGVLGDSGGAPAVAGVELEGGGAGVLHYDDLRIELADPPPPPPAEEFTRGDANGDGRFDIGDPIFVLGWQFRGSAAPACLDAADSNDDGKNDISDAIHALGCQFLGSACPPEPFETCGADPTPDALDGAGCAGACR